jgi:hypothetical protein
MKTLAIAMAAVMVLAAASLARTDQNAGKLPKCSGTLCRSVGCSPDVLCARGAAVVSCAEVCGGH